jgi:radical SAM protein with 4Fe4S-binding SPASM domain
MLQNEPLLDSKLAERVRKARVILGDAVRIAIVTNGQLLTEQRFGMLCESGLNYMGVSIDAFTPETYARIRPGLHFSKVVHNTQAALERSNSVLISARFLKQRANEGEEDLFRNYWQSKGATVDFDSLANRAGSVREFEQLKSRRSSYQRRFLCKILNRLIPSCPLPFWELAILLDGRVILCCHDWEHRKILGDLSRQSLKEIWNGNKINYYRMLLRQRRAENSSVCRRCSLAYQFWSE